FSVALLAALWLPLHASQTHKRSTPQKHSSKKTTHHTAHKLTPAQRARAARIKRAFVASSQLRPMAQQLIEARSPQAFSAVESYARAHRSESSGNMGWLVIGYAHLLDKQYDAAVPALQTARLHAGDLGDYADLFLAQALNGSGQSMAAGSALADFE